MKELLLGEAIAARAKEYLGAPTHQFRGPCSGFVTHVLTEVGLLIPPYITTCREYFDHIFPLVHFGQHKVGDLIFFSSNGLYPSHMGIMTDVDHYIHSSALNGRLVEEAILRRRIITNRHEQALYVYDPIGFKRPSVKLEQGYMWNIKVPPNPVCQARTLAKASSDFNLR